METTPQPTPKKSNTGMILGVGAIAVVVLLCCCSLAVIGILTMMGPAIGRTFSSINNSLMTPNFPDDFPDDFPTPDFDMPDGSFQNIPEGGRGDEILRASAWGYVVIAATLDNCTFTPQASDTRIEVTQEPDASGEWKEEWTVTCDDGSEKPYDVTFTPSAGGGTDVSVTSGD